MAKITVKEAAAILGVSENRIRNFLRDGRIKGRFIGEGMRGVWEVDKVSCEALAAERATHPPQHGRPRSATPVRKRAYHTEDEGQ